MVQPGPARIYGRLAAPVFIMTRTVMPLVCGASLSFDRAELEEVKGPGSNRSATGPGGDSLHFHIVWRLKILVSAGIWP